MSYRSIAIKILIDEWSHYGITRAFAKFFSREEEKYWKFFSPLGWMKYGGKILQWNSFKSCIDISFQQCEFFFLEKRTWKVNLGINARFRNFLCLDWREIGYSESYLSIYALIHPSSSTAINILTCAALLQRHCLPTPNTIDWTRLRNHKSLIRMLH